MVIDKLTVAQWLTSTTGLVLEMLEDGVERSVEGMAELFATAALSSLTRLESDPEALEKIELQFIEGLRLGSCIYSKNYLGMTLEQAAVSIEVEEAKEANQLH